MGSEMCIRDSARTAQQLVLDGTNRLSSSKPCAYCRIVRSELKPEVVLATILDPKSWYIERSTGFVCQAQPGSLDREDPSFVGSQPTAVTAFAAVIERRIDKLGARS